MQNAFVLAISFVALFSTAASANVRTQMDRLSTEIHSDFPQVQLTPETDISRLINFQAVLEENSNYGMAPADQATLEAELKKFGCEAKMTLSCVAKAFDDASN